MPEPQLPLHGACLCGAVRVKVTKAPLLTVACHCRDCQKFTASAYSLTTMFPRDGFFCEGEVALGGLKIEGRAHYFCKSCLNFIYSQIGQDSARVNVRTSILDDAGAYEPFLEIMTGEKMPWARVPAKRSYARHPETPEELQELFAEFSACH